MPEIVKVFFDGTRTLNDEKGWCARNVRLINLTSTSDRYKLLESSNTLRHLSSLIMRERRPLKSFIIQVFIKTQCSAGTNNSVFKVHKVMLKIKHQTLSFGTSKTICIRGGITPKLTNIRPMIHKRNFNLTHIILLTP